MSIEEEYEKAKEERQKYVDKILSSSAKKKIIVAGPGTGKSYLFQELLAQKNGDNLALTFLNNLANDLKADLEGVGLSYTFHAFCKRLLHKFSGERIQSDFHFYPKLLLIIKSDADILGNDLSNFMEAFRTLTEGDRLEFFLSRGDYYNAVGFDDSVYRVLKLLQSGEMPNPNFTQIVVDEYQDFCLLEVEFLNELAKKNDILIAGDDDQALYHFRSASAYHLRAKYLDPDYETFALPFCSRCPEVIIGAVGDIITKAEKFDKLRGRIEKDFFCYLPDKHEDSVSNPSIIHADCSTNTKPAPYIAKFIEVQIGRIPVEDIKEAREKGFPCVLIAGPSHYTRSVVDYLKERFSNIDISSKEPETVDILEGYEILVDDSKSNLGWRIVMESLFFEKNPEIIQKTYNPCGQIFDFLPREFQETHLACVFIFSKLMAGEIITEDEKTLIELTCRLEIGKINEFLNHQEEEKEETPPEIDEITIKITTFTGSKGLSAGYVFLLAMNNGDFPANPNGPTDNEICHLIVGITRTRKKCFLVSNRRFGANWGLRSSTFINWINPKRIEYIYADKKYFN